MGSPLGWRGAAQACCLGSGRLARGLRARATVQVLALAVLGFLAACWMMACGPSEPAAKQAAPTQELELETAPEPQPEPVQVELPAPPACEPPFADWATPRRFDDAVGAAALGRFRAGEWREAAEQFARLAGEEGREQDERCSAAWMSLQSLERLGRHEAALQRAEASVQPCALLRPYFVWASARALSQLGRHEEVLSGVARLELADAPYRDGQLLAARALLRLRRFEELDLLLRAYEARYGISAEEHGLRLDAARRQGQAELSERLLSEMIALWPQSWQAKMALRGEQAPAPSSGAGRELERARSELERRRAKTATNILGKVMARMPKGSDERCEAMLLLGRASVMRRERTQARIGYDAAMEDCAGSRWFDELLLDSAENLYQLHDLDESARRLDGLRIRQRHGSIDEALLLFARVQLDRQRRDSARALLETVLTRHPGTKLGAEAAFLLFWSRYREGELVEALVVLERALAMPIEASVRGRLDYWRGRTLQRLSQEDAAVAVFRALLAEHPHAYYALVAYARLVELEGEAPTKAFVESLRDEARYSLPCVGAELGWEALGETLKRQGLEFVALGLFDQAQSHFRELTPGQSADEDWLLSMLLSREGEIRRAYLSSRKLANDELSYLPVGPNEQRWPLVYPQPYAELVDSAVAAHPPVSRELVYGVMRQESGFRPDAQSPAQASGLMQLLLPTAQGLTQPGEPWVSRAMLSEPELNIRLGSRYLASLLQRLLHPALVVAAYNVGSRRLCGWVEERPGLMMDEFIEAMPYGATRDYVRSVLRSYGVYYDLRFGELPLLSFGAVLPCGASSAEPSSPDEPVVEEEEPALGPTEAPVLGPTEEPALGPTEAPVLGPTEAP